MALDYRFPSHESLLEFQEVYARVVALAWKDSVFLEELRKDARATLANYFGYMCPWNIDIEFEQLSGQEYEWQPGEDVWNLPKNAIHVGIPKKPPQLEEQAVALAVYNAAGPAYLFTCC